MKSVVVTGSAGLLGSEVASYFHARGWSVHGVDNNQRAVFFGSEGDTRATRRRLESSLAHYRHYDLDIRDRDGVLALIRAVAPAAIVHAAAQPSHDRAAQIPFEDFDTNAVGTMNLLEAARRFSPEAPFVFMSTNKVYGDGPNSIALKELETRWEFDDPAYLDGVPETFPIDRSTHSLFGGSKLAADVMVQEYGRYFGMPTCALRAGCCTGPNHAGVELHGFLSYLVRCNLEDREYRIFGYGGKQVRDNIHSLDVARFIERFVDAPRCGEVYNLGGGKKNTCSVIEAIRMVEECSGRRQRFSYLEENRVGDHICYYSDLNKIWDHFPGWEPKKSLATTVVELVASWRQRGAP